jgi:hypothetical protein
VADAPGLEEVQANGPDPIVGFEAKPRDELRGYWNSWYSIVMTTVAEIEDAIERLPAAQVKQLAEWLDEYQLMLAGSSALFAMLDAEEGEGAQWSDPNPPYLLSALLALGGL